MVNFARSKVLFPTPQSKLFDWSNAVQHIPSSQLGKGFFQVRAHNFRPSIGLNHLTVAEDIFLLELEARVIGKKALLGLLPQADVFPCLPVFHTELLETNVTDVR